MKVEKGDVVTLLMKDEFLLVNSVDEENKTFETMIPATLYFQELDLLLVENVYKLVKENDR